MKSIKMLIVLAVIAITCNVNAQILTPKDDHTTISKIEARQVQSFLIEGMVSFVESVRVFYAKGDTYEQFKLKVLIGDEAAVKTALPMSTLPIEGEEMIRKAYLYLSKGYVASQIAKVDNGVTFGEAAAFIYDYDSKKNKSSVNGDVALFGGNQITLDNNLLNKTSKKKCKWYNVLCHGANLVNWIADNSEAIVSAAGTIAGVIAIFK